MVYKLSEIFEVLLVTHRRYIGHQSVAFAFAKDVTLLRGGVSKGQSVRVDVVFFWKTERSRLILFGRRSISVFVL
jgi:hypothetical protein